jgi:hypothetical protein
MYDQYITGSARDVEAALEEYLTRTPGSPDGFPKRDGEAT